MPKLESWYALKRVFLGCLQGMIWSEEAQHIFFENCTSPPPQHVFQMEVFILMSLGVAQNRIGTNGMCNRPPCPVCDALRANRARPYDNCPGNPAPHHRPVPHRFRTSCRLGGLRRRSASFRWSSRSCRRLSASRSRTSGRRGVVRGRRASRA